MARLIKKTAYILGLSTAILGLFFILAKSVEAQYWSYDFSYSSGYGGYYYDSYYPSYYTSYYYPSYYSYYPTYYGYYSPTPMTNRFSYYDYGGPRGFDGYIYTDRHSYDYKYDRGRDWRGR